MLPGARNAAVVNNPEELRFDLKTSSNLDWICEQGGQVLFAEGEIERG
jgi:hypothetical protein